MLNDVSRVAGPFAGDDVTTALPLEFKLFAGSDIDVLLTDSTGVRTTAVLDVDYTVTLNADQETDPGGVVTLTNPLASGYTCSVVSALPYDQPLDLHNAGRFHAQRIEDQFDRVVMQIQQEADSLARCVRAPSGESLSELSVAALRADKLLSFDADGNPTTVAPSAQSATALALLLADSTTIADGAGAIGFNPDLAYPDGTVGAELIRKRTPEFFGSDIVPTKHLRQFGARLSGGGAGAIPGTATIVGTAITAVATGTGGANYAVDRSRVLVVGDGTGARVSIASVGGSGEITGYTVDAGGTGYTTAQIIVVDGPVVVVVGDSISTEQPNPSNLGASQWHLLCAAIRAANPSRNIAFFNRAVGAQTWTTLDQQASSNWPDWYSNHAKDWLDYIEELHPDLVVCGFGMNDRENMVFSRVNSALATMLAWTDPRPDIVLVTPLVPSRLDADPDISGAVAQNGRDACAGYTRGAALTNSLGFLDMNRRLRLVRDGYDTRQCALREIASSAQALPWTATQDAEGDFSLSMSFTAMTFAGKTLTLGLGTVGANTLTRAQIDNSGGYVRVTVEDYSPATLATSTQEQVTSTLATPGAATDVTFDVIVQDQHLSIAINGIAVYANTIKRYSGAFAPTVAYSAAATPTITYCAGRYARYADRMEDAELWGTSDSGDYGGNEANHPSALAIATVMAPVIWEADWSHVPMAIGGDSNGVTTFVGMGEPDPLARLHITKRGHATDISPSATANNLVLEDETAPGMSILSGSSGVARWTAGDSDDSAKASWAYNHTTDQWVLSIDGVTLFAVNASQVKSSIPSAPYSGTKAAIGALTGMTAGATCHCTDETGGAVLVFYDGANWRRVTDRAVMS